MKNKRNIRLHPAIVFLLLTIIVMIVSSVGGILHLETSYNSVNAVTGDITTQVVNINNLFNRTGIQYLISNMINNFINFAPLVNIIVGLIGVGVAYKSGFLNSLFKMIGKVVPRKTLTFVVVLLGVISTMFSEVGYVILIPLSAILFMNLGRHPSAGICAAFAGITFGMGAGVVANNIDSVLLDYTSSAVSILDSSYNVSISGNLFFMIISTILIAYLGTFITERYIIPKLGKYTFDEEEPSQDSLVSIKEKKGVILSLLVTFILVLILIYCITPGLPFSGLLLYLKDTSFVDQLFGYNSYFKQGVVTIVSFLLIFAGLVYGIRVKTIRNNRDLVNAMNYYLKEISSILVLIFFAAQFCLIFKETNIGVFIVASLTEILSNLELSGILLIIVCFILTIIGSIFVPALGTKWAIMAPIMVPMFMQNSLTPEFAQAVFRGASSATLGITPLFTYFVILIGFLEIYNKRKNDTVTITDAMSLMVPYTIAYSILWLLIILAFYVIGLPIGPGVSVMI